MHTPYRGVLLPLDRPCPLFQEMQDQVFVQGLKPCLDETRLPQTPRPPNRPARAEVLRPRIALEKDRLSNPFDAIMHWTFEYDLKPFPLEAGLLVLPRSILGKPPETSFVLSASLPTTSVTGRLASSSEPSSPRRPDGAVECRLRPGRPEHPHQHSGRRQDRTAWRRPLAVSGQVFRTVARPAWPSLCSRSCEAEAQKSSSDGESPAAYSREQGVKRLAALLDEAVEGRVKRGRSHRSSE